LCCMGRMQQRERPTLRAPAKPSNANNIAC